MVASIAHRATGIALAAGTLMLSWWLIAAIGYQLYYRSSNVTGTLANYSENIGYVRLTFTY